MAGGKRPDYNMSFVMRGQDDHKGTIGVAWKSDNDDNRIKIRLNPKVVLEWHPDLFITLFPIEYNADGSQKRSERSGSSGGSRRGRRDDDDDIPF
jgi:hypothetical protein